MLFIIIIIIIKLKIFIHFIKDESEKKIQNLNKELDYQHEKSYVSTKQINELKQQLEDQELLRVNNFKNK